MYDSKVGRWLSEDPIGFGAQDINLVRYVDNRPLELTDHLGLAPPEVLDPSKLDWPHFKPIAGGAVKPGDTATEGARIGYKYVRNDAEPEYRKIGDRWQVTLKVEYFLVDIDKDKSERVVGKETDLLLGHEREHLCFAQALARKFEKQTDFLTVTGTGPSKEEALKDAKAKQTALINQFTTFFDAAQKYYDRVTEHHIDQLLQMDWEECKEKVYDKVWSKYPTFPTQDPNPPNHYPGLPNTHGDFAPLKKAK